MEKLAIKKSCSFCGSTAYRVEFRDSKGKGTGPRFSAFVKCSKCYARGPRVSTYDKVGKTKLENLAILAWNCEGPVPWNSEGPIASFEAEK